MKNLLDILIPENDNFFKRKCLVLPEFLKNKNFIDGKRNILAHENFIFKLKNFEFLPC
jgi:hypothetical protein